MGGDYSKGLVLFLLLRAALEDPGLEAIILCPSNPYLSIDPILSVPGVGQALAASTAPVIAVSPIVAGRALKGPTAKIMAELGVQSSAANVARHYQGLINGFVLDDQDSDEANAIREAGITVTVTNTVMENLKDRQTLAQAVLDFAAALTGADVVTGRGNVGTGSR